MERIALPAAAEEASWGDALRVPFAALAAGDVEALETVWELASRRLYGLALWRTGSPDDAGDVVQEVFIKLAERRGELAQVRSPHVWLLSLAHHAAVDLTRRRRVRRTEPLEGPALLVASGDDPARAAEAASLSRLLASLPDAQREAVALRHLAGCSFREIAKVTGVPTFTAASRCRLGLARLREAMGASR